MRIAITAAIVLLGAALPAQAADPLAVSTEAAALAVPAPQPGFDWTGFYAGVFGSAGQSVDDGGQLGLGLNAGVNAQFDFVLVGAEVTLQGLSGDTIDTAYGQVLGRTGVVITDDVLLYAAAGYGWDLGGSGSGGGAFAGGGLELALSDNVSVRAQYLRGFDDAATTPSDQVTLGASFHF